jgi:hypothetical protein
MGCSPVNSDIQAHKFNEGLVITKAKERGKIVGIIFGWINGREFSFTKDIAVDSSRDVGEFRDPRRSSSERIGDWE